MSTTTKTTKTTMTTTTTAAAATTTTTTATTDVLTLQIRVRCEYERHGTDFVPLLFFFFFFFSHFPCFSAYALIANVKIAYQ
jgi:hypothetical protein